MYKIINYLFCLLFVFFISEVSFANKITIVDNGHSTYQIVANMNGPQSIRAGAKTLQRLIKISTGVKLPIVNHLSEGKVPIVIGENELALSAGITSKELPHDAFYLIIKHSKIYLVGKDDNIQKGFYDISQAKSSSAGSYNAVIEFAHRFLNVHWYMPSPYGKEIPHKPVLQVPAEFHLTVKPGFAFRYMDVVASWKRISAAFTKKRGFSKQIFYSANAVREATRWGRHLRVGFVRNIHTGHAWWKWVPANKPSKYAPKMYGKEHPEYFAMVNGKRQNHYIGNYGHLGGQLNILNPDVARVYANNVIAYAKKTGRRSFSLTQNDGGKMDQGAKSQRLDSMNPPRIGPRGQRILTDRILRFDNEIVRQVLNKVPDAQFYALAYYNTVMPPLEVSPNPHITMSDVYNMMPFRYYSPGGRKWMTKQITDWRRKVSSITLDTYYTGYGFYSLPWSTVSVQAWMVKLLAKFPSSSGIRFNYLHSSPPAIGMLGPDPWILAKLMWNPNQSVHKLTKQWYIGCFGPEAGALVQKYFDVINNAMIGEIHRHPYNSKKSITASIRDYVVPVYSSIRYRCHAIIAKAVSITNKMPKRYKWRMNKIERGWRYVELTLDAIKASKYARSVNTLSAYKKAVEIGKKRIALASDANSALALSPIAMVDMGSRASLGIITEIPPKFQKK